MLQFKLNTRINIILAYIGPFLDLKSIEVVGTCHFPLDTWHKRLKALVITHSTIGAYQIIVENRQNCLVGSSRFFSKLSIDIKVTNHYRHFCRHFQACWYRACLDRFLSISSISHLFFHQVISSFRWRDDTSRIKV